jgi:p-cumate 2,3-dioxygenase subunit alpha
VNKTVNKSLIIDDSSNFQFKVPRKAFVDPDIFEMEKKKIFDTCWLYLGHESELPEKGDFKRRRVGGRELIFNKDTEGKINAFLNTCPHRGALVCREEEGRTKVFRCFYHAWTFNSKGNLIATPSAKGYAENFNCSGEANLHEVPRIDSYRGFIFVNFDPNAISLSDYLGNAKEYLDLVADQSLVGMEIVGDDQRYSMRANWKLLVENSSDGYHGLPTHKTYFDYLKSRGGEVSNEDIIGVGHDLGNGHGVVEYTASWGRPIANWIPAWGEDGKQELENIKQALTEKFGEDRAERICKKNRNIIIFPNLVINDIMAITVRVIDPISPDYMEVKGWALAPKEENEKFRERRLKTFLEFLGPGGFATPDDNEALELCQEGFKNNKEVEWNILSRGMAREQPAADDESQIRGFWRKWDDLIVQD